MAAGLRGIVCADKKCEARNPEARIAKLVDASVLTATQAEQLHAH